MSSCEKTENYPRLDLAGMLAGRQLHQVVASERL
jgi:hypothetical protein